MKKIALIACILVIVIGFIWLLVFNNVSNETEDNGKLNVVVTSFSSYDFVRHIVGDNANVTFLLGPGMDAHSYDPSASDIIKIGNADMFVYIGDEMEKWAERVVETLDTKNTVLVKISDSIEIIEEKNIDGTEHEEHDDNHHEHEEVEYDEHVWSSPENAIKIMDVLTNHLIEVDPDRKEEYEKNSEEYILEIRDVQSQIQDIVDNKERSRLVFADKMPMQYFINEFKLDVSAAFNSCSTETEPSTSTIAYLINKVKEENIPVVLYIELGTDKVANTIAKETGAIPMQIQTLHNVTKTDFDNGETYVSLMRRNLDVLKKALQ